jgi:hypothetical protein
MPALALEVLIPMFFSDLKDAQRSLLEGSMNQPIPDVPIEDIFTLYRRTNVMLKLYSAYCPK